MHPNKSLKNCNFTQAIINGNSTDSATPNIDFSDVDYSGAIFQKAQIKNINFNNVNFKGCDFSETELDHVNFDNTNFQLSKFEATKFKNDFSITNADMYKVNINNVISTFSGNINSSDMSQLSLSNSNIPNFSFKFKKADNSKFIDSTISSIYQENINASGSTLSYVNKENVFEIYNNGTTTFQLIIGPNLTRVLNSEYPNSKTYPDYDESLLEYKKRTETNLTCLVQPNNQQTTIVYPIISNQYSSSVTDFVSSMHDQKPFDSVKNIKTKNLNLSNISGRFVDSDFSSSAIGYISGYFNNCKFNNLNQSNSNNALVSDSIILNSDFTNATSMYRISRSYIKGSTLAAQRVNQNSMFINSSVSIQNPSLFFAYNSSVSGASCSTEISYQEPESVGETQRFACCSSESNSVSPHWIYYKVIFNEKYFIPRCEKN